MARSVDPKRTRKALRAVRRVAALRETEQAPDFSAWEQEFLLEVEARLAKYGSAFNDSSKGRLDEALSMLQGQKLREIAAKGKATKEKAKPKDNAGLRRGGGFKRKARPRLPDPET